MGIDIQKMRAKKAALESKGGNRNAFWKPSDGEQIIRIVPTDDGDPFKEYFFHYNLGKNRGFLCPKRNFGEHCPVCDFVRALYSEGDEESVKTAKSLNAKQRFFSPVLVRGEEAEGVKAWGYGKKAYTKLLNLVLDPDYGDITDVDNGTDLTLKYGKESGASYPTTDLTPKRRTSPLVESSEEIAELLTKVPNFEEMFEKKTPVEIQAMLDEFLLGEEDAEEASNETSRYGEKSKELDAVEKAFQELQG